MVSLQFHVQHDGLFETLRPTVRNLPTLSTCKYLSLFNKSSPHHFQSTADESGPNIVILDQDQHEKYVLYYMRGNNTYKFPRDNQHK